MTDDVVSNREQITARWLTEVLVESGALTHGAVERVELDSLDRDLSQITHLTLFYSSDSSGKRPTQLLLKVSGSEIDPELVGPSEVEYYTRDYLGLEGLPILNCYSGVFSEERDVYHILMDDVSSTHTNGWEQRPFSIETHLTLAESLARMHAHWWGVDQLNAKGAPLPTAEEIKRYVEIAKDGLEPMLVLIRGEISPEWEAALYDFFEHHPQKMIERSEDANGFTLVHGDVNPGNILLPRDGEGQLYLIDRQPFEWSLTTWLGASEFSYLIGHWEEPEARRAMEIPVLKHYHRHLEQLGVTDFAWEQLFYDYQLCTAQNIYISTEWCRGSGIEHKDAWFPMLKRAMAAFEGLDCARLWQ